MIVLSSLIANLAAATSFHVDHLMSEENLKLIENAKIFYVTGFLINVSLSSALFLAEHAFRNDKVGN
jgi:adenosine kinase